MKVTSEVNVMKKCGKLAVTFGKMKISFLKFSAKFLVDFLSYHSTGVKVQCMNMHLGVCSVKRDKKSLQYGEIFHS